ncbi:nickel pincer cofactor biosynthesis protein LarC [bacterium]|nr:nickel pincer cofactor biosynthesis protein LarC [bacterium]
MSGDLLLGAWLDLGYPREALLSALAPLSLPGLEIEVERGQSRDFGDACASSRRKRDPHRRAGEILELVAGAGLSERARGRAERIYTFLANAEGRVHGKRPEDIHFHEVGALDAVVDVLGSVLAADYFGLETIIGSPVVVGGGTAACRHGDLPVPAPATLFLLEGIPIRGGGIEQELATPTGAAILRGLCTGFGPFPEMIPEKTGYGLGHLDLGRTPNVLRITLGRAAGQPVAVEVLETHIDDMNPEFYDLLFERLLEAGALDVTLAPVQMKKNRPGVHVTVLTPQGKAEELAEVLIEETSTLGVRISTARRWCVERRVEEVETPYGPVRVKVRAGRHPRPAPEYADCARLAKAKGVPAEVVYRAALAAWRRE